MAKKNETANSRRRLNLYDDEFLNTIGSTCIEDAIAFLKTMFYIRQDGDQQFRQHWDRDFQGAMCPLLIGAPGVGKSSIIRQVARELGYDYIRLPMGDMGEEDIGGVFDLNNSSQDGGYEYMLPSLLQPAVRAPNGGGGIICIDEIGTGQPMKQNMVAQLLTDGAKTGFYGHKIHPGWFFAATTNPETMEYTNNNVLDARLRDRMQPLHLVPKTKETLHYLSVTNAVPSKLLGFLRINEHVLNTVSPRAWETLGNAWFKWGATRAMPLDSFLQRNGGVFVNAMGTLNELLAYLRKGGDNPDLYPVMARQIVDASDEEFKEMTKRCQQWALKQEDILSAATCWDIASFLQDGNIRRTTDDTRRLLSILELTPRSEIVFEAIDRALHTADESGRTTMELAKAEFPEIAKKIARLYNDWHRSKETAKKEDDKAAAAKKATKGKKST